MVADPRITASSDWYVIESRLDGPPARHSFNRDPDERAGLQAMRDVLLVLRPERLHRRTVLTDVLPAGLEDRRGPVAAKPGKACPILVPPVDQDRDPRIPPQVADPRQPRWFGDALRFLVERGVEDWPGGVEHEADRHEPRPAIRRGRGQDASPRRGQERPLRR